jgi:type IV pilus assembly protein PilM
MGLLKGVGNFFALDIGTNAIRVVQLSKSGTGSWSLEHYGYTPLPANISNADSADAKHRLGETIMTAIGQSGIRTKDVVVGLPSQKTFTTVIDVPSMGEAELKSTIKYQIDQYIPMAIDDAKVDWQLLGQSLRDPKQLEVLLTSTAISYAEDRLELVEGLGLNVIAAEPDPIAMVRSVLPEGVTDARLIIDVGEQSTDIVMTYGDAPRLVRTVPIGLTTLIKSAVQNLNVQDEQARQFILKFGLAPDRLEGQVLRALESTLENFISELSKSIKFFQTRYPSISVGGIIASGFGSSIPRFNDYVAAKTSLQVMLGNPWQRVKVSQADQQKLTPISYEFATAIGLAQRSNS